METSSTSGTTSSPKTQSENLSSPATSTLSKSFERERPLSEVISEQFPPFDAQTLVAQPFQNEAEIDAKYEKDLSALLLKVMLETHAWASTRPKFEATRESQKLEDELSQIMEVEQEQGTSRSPAPSICSSSSSFSHFALFEHTRARLGEFVRKMKTALAALTDINS